MMGKLNRSTRHGANPATAARGILDPGVLALSACGTVAEPAGSAEVHDPAEGVNRRIFTANQFVDRNVLAPVARGYRDYTPQVVQRSVGNFSRNLRQPVVLTNDLLQGNVGRAWNTTQRFVVNSTAGVGGLFDLTETVGLPPGHDASFAQTLGVWGVAPGPAVHLPLLGASSARDAAGMVLGFAADPLSPIPGGAMSTISTVGMSAGMVNGHAAALETTDALQATSLDPYAAMRSAQAQRSARMVEEGRRGTPTTPVAPLPEAGSPPR